MVGIPGLAGPLQAEGHFGQGIQARGAGVYQGCWISERRLGEKADRVREAILGRSDDCLKSWIIQLFSAWCGGGGGARVCFFFFSFLFRSIDHVAEFFFPFLFPRDPGPFPVLCSSPPISVLFFSSPRLLMYIFIKNFSINPGK